MPSRNLLWDHLWYWVFLRTSVCNLDCLPRDTNQCRSSSSLPLIDRRNVWLDHKRHRSSTKARHDSQDKRNPRHDKHYRSPSRFVDDLLHFQWGKDQSQSREYLRSFFLVLVRRTTSDEWCLSLPPLVSSFDIHLILSFLLCQWRVNLHHHLFRHLPILIVSESEPLPAWNRMPSGSIQCALRSATDESKITNNVRSSSDDEDKAIDRWIRWHVAERLFHLVKEESYLEAREWEERGRKCAGNGLSSRIGSFDKFILFIPWNFKETIDQFEIIINTRDALMINNREF